MELWHWWVIGGIVLFILEIFTPGFVLACFGVSCLLTAGVSFLNGDIKVQILTFSVASIVIFFGIRPFFLRYISPYGKGVKTNVDALVGRAGIVTEDIDPDKYSGRVIVGGEDWRAVSNKGEAIVKGSKIIVKRVEGTKLFVE